MCDQMTTLPLSDDGAAAEAPAVHDHLPGVLVAVGVLSIDDAAGPRHALDAALTAWGLGESHTPSQG